MFLAIPSPPFEARQFISDVLNDQPTIIIISGVTKVIVREEDVRFLTEFLSTYSYKWEDIGTALNFLDGELKAIPMNNPRGSVQQFLKELLNQWIQWPTDDHREEPTLDKLCAALRGRLVGLGAVANNLHAKRTSLPSQCQP